MRLSPDLQFISNILSLSLKPDHSHIEPNPMLDHLNWDKFIPLATYHGVGGLLVYWLRKLKIEINLPDHVSRSLHGIYESVVDMWEDYQKIIKKILMQCYESEIEIVLLKGGQLGHTDYPHFSLRPMEDIDLLVRGSDKLRIINLMLEMGFSLYQTGETCDKFFITQNPKRSRKKTQRPIFVEVHSNLQVPIRLNKSFSIDIAEFWNGGKMEYLDRFPFLQLVPTYNLIYLCVHLGEHYFSRLIWSYDIALLIYRHREEIDWEKLKDLCERMKIRNPLYQSLTLCRDFFHIPIPETVLKNLSPSWWKKRIGYFLIRRNLERPERSRGNRLTQFLIKIFLVDSWMEAILWFFIPTRKWMVREYSLEDSKEIYPYYLLHPILYLIKAMKAPVR